MYQLIIGIEHLMTGVQIQGQGDNPITFDRESASTMRLTSDAPFSIYWPVKQVYLEATEAPEAKEIKHGSGEVEWYAQVMTRAMARVDIMSNWEGETIPEPVVRSMRNKFGENATAYIQELKRDGMNGCWYYTHAGMYVGVEDDGYQHT